MNKEMQRHHVVAMMSLPCHTMTAMTFTTLVVHSCYSDSTLSCHGHHLALVDQKLPAIISLANRDEQDPGRCCFIESHVQTALPPSLPVQIQGRQRADPEVT